MPIIAPPVVPSSGVTLLTLGRLALPTIGKDFKEGVGEPLDTTGAGVALGQRRPKMFGLELPLFVIPDGTTGGDPVYAGMRMRRQLRSLLQNHVLRGQGIYLAFLADPEVNGWVMVGNGQIAYADGAVVFGNFLLTLDEIYKVADRTTYRPGVRCVNADLRLSTTPRDLLEQIYSVDFAGSGALAWNYLPPGTSCHASTAGSALSFVTWGGKDGAGEVVIGALSDEVVAFEQPEANRNLGQVVAYDRRGNLTGPSAGPDPLWEEVYGKEWPWSWQTTGIPDAPVLDNGRCRVRFDGTVGLPGFRLDVWTGTAWSEQAKVVFGRRGPSAVSDDTWVSAGLTEACTPERTVMQIVMRSTADGNSLEVIYVTLQRGWSGPRFEIYPLAAGTVRGASISLYTTTTSVASTRVANAWTIPSSGYLIAGAVVQAASVIADVADSAAYGVTRQGLSTYVDGQGYASVRVSFYPLATSPTAAGAEIGAASLMDCRQVPVLVER